MADTFASQISDWARKTEQQQSVVLHASLRKLDEALVEKTPMVSGNLRNSRAISTLGPVTIDWKVKKFRNSSDAVNNAIAGVEVGQTAWLGFRAPYAHKIEPKAAMIRLAAQRWQQIVNDAVRAVRGGGQ